MTTFKIFAKSEKFVWTRSRILFGIFLLSFGIFAIKFYFINKKEFDVTIQIFGYICVGTVFLGLINSFQTEQLEGKLDGDLILDFDKIIINDNIYDLKEIKSMQIITGPIKGQLISSGTSIFWEKFSNGINNELIIAMNSGEVIKCNFQIEHERKILQATDELKHYVDEGKLSKENYVEINR